MKRKLLIAIAIIIVVLLICVVMQSKLFKTAEDRSFGWNANKSFFVDYYIKDDSVFVRYSICFTNNTEKDYFISPPVADFKSKELKGWANSDPFLGSFENSNTEYCIKAHTEENIVIVFEGKYLGGTVNENLSPPKTMVFSVTQ